MAQTTQSTESGESAAPGSLFQGAKFWIAQKVPQRSRFVADVDAGGGRVVALEKQADYKIVDHAKRQQLPGTHSYRFIELSVRNGRLEDPDQHLILPDVGQVRAAGSITQPAKGTRKKFTQAEDHLLLQWVRDHRQRNGGTDGNDIYKDLEKEHPEHPWQSWRDRFVKYLKVEYLRMRKSEEEAISQQEETRDERPHEEVPPPQALQAHNTDENQLEERQDPRPTEPNRERLRTRHDEDEVSHHGGATFDRSDVEKLLAQAENINDMDKTRLDEGWDQWARDADDDRRSGAQWRQFWEDFVQPKHLARQTNHSRPAEDRSNSLVERPQVAMQSRSISNIPQSDGPVESRKAAPRPRPSSKLTVPTSSHGDNPAPRVKKRAFGEHRDGDASAAGPSQPAKKPAHSSGRQDSKANDVHPSERDAPWKHDFRMSILMGAPNNAGVIPPPNAFSPLSPEEMEAMMTPDASKSDDDDNNGASLFLPPKRPSMDTQAILAEKTQIPDLDLPPPPDDDDDDLYSLPPLSPSAPGATSSPREQDPEPEERDLDAKLDGWIGGFVAKGLLAHTAETILEATSLDTELAELVLERLLKDTPQSRLHDTAVAIPENIPGVWTAQDDEALTSSDKRQVTRVMEKHGTAYTDARFEFLEYLRGS